MPFKPSWTLLVLCSSLLLQASVDAIEHYEWDSIIVDARIVDGSGDSWYRGSLAIRDGRIAWIGTEPPPGKARRVYHADGLVLAPGFIDLMGQSTLAYLQDPASAASKLTQGITTHFSGEGWSHAPQNDRTVILPVPPVIDGKPLRWTTLNEYLAILEKYGVPVNVVHNVGAEQVRRVVMGDTEGAPTPVQLEQMRKLVDQAMREGAAGLSSALIYPPGAFASTDELVELAKVVGRYGGFYSTHIRNESGGLLRAIDEAISIGERAHVPVHIYHLKAAGQDNWPLMRSAIQRITDARARGLDVTADIYPYVRNGLFLDSFVPPSAYANGTGAFLKSLERESVRTDLRRRIEEDTSWENWYQHAGRDWHNVLITGSEAGKDLVGLSISEAARKRGHSDWQFFFDTLKTRVQVAPLSMNEEQKRLALQVPWVMIATDENPASPSSTAPIHPRAYGSFPRILAKYVRAEHVLTLEDAIRRMTSAPANLLGLYDRGRIAPGLAADLVLFDPATVQDNATYESPSLPASGIRYVWVNGTLSVDGGHGTGARAGRVLRSNSRSRTADSPNTP